MALEIVDFLLFIDIVYFYLSIAISKGNFVVITEGDWTDVVIHLGCLIDPCDIGRAAWPYVERGIKSNSYLIIIRPGKQVEIEIVL